MTAPRAPRALITGASGFVARHLIRELRMAGVERITGIDRWPDAPPGYDCYVRLSLGSANEGGALSATLARAEPDLIFHLVGGAGGSRSEIVASNVLAGAELLDAVETSAPGTSVVFVGSAAEYGESQPGAQIVAETHPCVPRSDYGIAKFAQTQLALAAAQRGVCAAVARPFNLVGPGVPALLFPGAVLERAAAALSRGEDCVVMGNMESARDFLDVRDAARALRMIAAARASGDVFNVCTGRAVPVFELAAGLLERFPRPLSIASDPALLRTTDPASSAGDPAKLTARCGWTPQWTLEASLDDTYRAFADERVLQ